MSLVLKTYINYPSDLKQEFKRMNRDYFSYEGYQALIDYFDDIDNNDTELDVIGICCDFSEDTIQDFIKDHDIDILSKDEWLDDQNIEGDDRDLFDDEYEEYRIETIKEYADYNLGWYQLLNDDTSIIYVG